MRGIADGCRMAGCALIGGETAEMPGLYARGDYDLAGFAVGAAERGTLLPRLDTIADGDIVLGLASSGVHSNGYSLVRRIVDMSRVMWADPCPFAPETSLGEALLTPTRIYVKPLLQVLRGSNAHGLKALAHVTGGGFPDNSPRVLPDEFAAHLDLASLNPPPVFGWLARAGGVEEHEMLRTFNCGIGMVIVVDPASADALATELTALGETVTKFGKIKPRNGGDPVIYHGQLPL